MKQVRSISCRYSKLPFKFVGDRILLKITDASLTRYEVPESVLPRPKGNVTTNALSVVIRFDYTASPVSFSISRTSTCEVLFTTAGHTLISEPQYLSVKCSLPSNQTQTYTVLASAQIPSAFQLTTQLSHFGHAMPTSMASFPGQIYMEIIQYTSNTATRALMESCC